MSDRHTDLYHEVRRKPRSCGGAAVHDSYPGAYLREQTHHRHRALIDAHRSLLPEEGMTSAWWQLPAGQTYLWAWLPTHLRSAGLDEELRVCLHQPGWLVGKLEHVGPAG